jgi:hypothetical protein
MYSELLPHVVTSLTTYRRALAVNSMPTYYKFVVISDRLPRTKHSECLNLFLGEYTTFVCQVTSFDGRYHTHYCWSNYLYYCNYLWNSTQSRNVYPQLQIQAIDIIHQVCLCLVVQCNCQNSELNSTESDKTE